MGREERMNARTLQIPPELTEANARTLQEFVQTAFDQIRGDLVSALADLPEASRPRASIEAAREAVTILRWLVVDKMLAATVQETQRRGL